MLTSVAVLLVGIWLILQSIKPVDATLTLVFGIVVGALALIDLLSGRIVLPRSPAS
jgi:uncharacterized membrane protein YqgA involved in biofilm formation